MNSRLKFLYRTLLVLVFSSPFCLASATTYYPDNPTIDTNAIYLSGSGIARFELETMHKTWLIYPEKEFFETVATDTVILTGSKSGVIAVSKLTGKKKWEITTDTPLFTPVVNKQTAYIAGEDGSLRAVNLADDSLLWQQVFPGWIYPPAVIKNILITGGSHGVLWAVDSATGNLVWEFDLQGRELVYRPVATTLSALVSLFDGQLLAINATDGKIIWKYDAHVTNTIPVMSEDNILLTGWNGVMTALSIHAGNLKWRTTFSDHRFHPVTVTDDYLLISDDFGEIFVLNEQDGSIMNRICLKQGAVSSPVQLNSKLYLPIYSQQTGYKLLYFDISSKVYQLACG